MFEQEIAQLLTKHTSLSKENILELLEIPPSRELGDYAFPCFSLAKERKMAPPQIAQDLAAQITIQEPVREIKAVGPYVNFILEERVLVLSAIQEATKENFGKGAKKTEKVMIEYSQPNTHKAFHVGHIRGTALGEALSRILKYGGYEVVQANYSGDTGMHVAKWLWCYNTFHKGEKPEKDKGRWLASIYVEAVQKLEGNEQAESEVQALNIALDKQEDKELMELWKETRQWSIDEFNQIYQELNAHFDNWWFEREMESRAKEVSRELEQKGVAKESDGAIIMDLEDVGKSVWVLLRADGTPLYSAKDIALAEKKFEEFNIDRSIYIVGQAQALHMQQLFETLKRMGFAQGERCSHLGYEEVRLPEGKMSSRTGANIIYDDLHDMVFSYTEKEIRERHEEWDDEKVQETVQAVSVCAMKFEMMHRDHNKPITFSVENVCSFEGDTGPYIQYTHARCCSILKNVTQTKGTQYEQLADPTEIALAKRLLSFEKVIANIGNSLEVNELTQYTLTLSREFNAFYHTCKVIGDDLEAERSQLVTAARNTIAKSLDLLGIQAPKEM